MNYEKNNFRFIGSTCIYVHYFNSNIINFKQLLTMKIQIESIFGNLIFEYDCENNTIRKTVEEAIKQNISLNSANLRSANLSLANLRSADLSLANLRLANLSSADLSLANLCSANLRSADLSLANLSSADLSLADLSLANLSLANLRSADLRSADLRSADLSLANLRSANLSSADLPIFCKWNYSIINDKIRIGCKIQSIEEWDLFFSSDEVYETQRDTQEFRQIESVYLACKAYLTHLNGK